VIRTPQVRVPRLEPTKKDEHHHHEVPEATPFPQTQVLKTQLNTETADPQPQWTLIIIFLALFILILLCCIIGRCLFTLTDEGTLTSRKGRSSKYRADEKNLTPKEKPKVEEKDPLTEPKDEENVADNPNQSYVIQLENNVLMSSKTRE